MEIKPIRTDADHTAALREIEVLWGAGDGTAEGDRVDMVAALIGKNRAAEVLKRQRALTLLMIRRIAREWHVPERLLVKEYRLAE